MTVKNIVRKTLGIIILVLFLPLIFGFSSMDGDLCAYGKCDSVEPFWGGFYIGLQLDLFIAAILAIIAFVVRLLIKD